MNTIRHILGAFVLVIGLASCGDESGEPLLAGDVVGSYEGNDFVPLNGFATMTEGGSYVIAFGTGPIACGSESAPTPPPGRSAAIRAPALAVGTYNSVFVNVYQNVGGFESAGSSEGTLIITSVTDDSIAGEIQYDYTSAANGHYVLSGTFEVVHCAY